MFLYGASIGINGVKVMLNLAFQFDNMNFSILEQVTSTDPLYTREREKVLIRKSYTFHGGINKDP